MKIHQKHVFSHVSARSVPSSKRPLQRHSRGVQVSFVLDAAPSLLVEGGAGGARWFRDLKVPDGTDGYELLEAAVEGELEATWSAEFQSHFVTRILGDSPEGNAFWGVFVWNDGRSAWEPLPVGADHFNVEEGRVMGWALIEYDPDNPQLPVSVP